MVANVLFLLALGFGGVARADRRLPAPLACVVGCSRWAPSASAFARRWAGGAASAPLAHPRQWAGAIAILVVAGAPFRWD